MEGKTKIGRLLSRNEFSAYCPVLGYKRVWVRTSLLSISVLDFYPLRLCETNADLMYYEVTQKLFTAFLSAVLQSTHLWKQPSKAKPWVVGCISEEDSAYVIASVRTIANMLFGVSCIISILCIDIFLPLSTLQMSCHTEWNEERYQETMQSVWVRDWAPREATGEVSAWTLAGN